MKTKDQEIVRILVRARDDFQSMRKRMDNRAGLKADGTQQDVDRLDMDLADAVLIAEIAKEARKEESAVEKELKNILKRFMIYTEWLVDVKGVGTIASGRLLGEFDIEKATTVSKMWQFAGLNPGQIRGKKSVNEKDYKPEMGEIFSELPPAKDGSKRLCVLTDEMVRGDKATKEFVLPYNKKLKSALMGVLAEGFIKAKSHYALEYYYPYKQRLENSDREVLHRGKMVPWKDVNKGHRDMAAKRYMIKMFLKDFYVAWREIEGLPVREPYAEEYLGKTHEGGKVLEFKRADNAKETAGKKRGEEVIEA